MITIAEVIRQMKERIEMIKADSAMFSRNKNRADEVLSLIKELESLLKD